MNNEVFAEMQELRDKCSRFIKDTSTPIKNYHSEDIKKYLRDFIAFPGTLAIVSIFFASSKLVKSPNLAILGLVLIISSLLLAFNIFRSQINKDGNFYKTILKIESPMVNFSQKLTLFDGSEAKEKDLVNSYHELKKSHTNYLLENNYVEDDLIPKINSIYKQINFSFYLLVGGIAICFLSAFMC